MGLRGSAAIVGIGEGRPSRLHEERGELRLSLEQWYALAAREALKSAGLTKKDLEGQGLGVARPQYWTCPAIWSVEVAETLGLSVKWLECVDHGGANALALLAKAALAIKEGLVELVLCLAADCPVSSFTERTFAGHRRDFQRPIGMMGPNTMFALVMKRHMELYGTTREDTGKIAVTQRFHASLNPNAYLREPITLDDYLNARPISDPIRLLDCCIQVDNGLAFVVASPKRAQELGIRPVYLLGYGEYDNYYHGSKERPDTTITGIRLASREAFRMAGISPQRADFYQIYDDYPIAVLMQLEDMGLCEKGKGGPFVRDHDLSYKGDFPINTGGGQLSAGQPGLAGGFVPLVEAVRQLRGEAGERQVKGAKVGVVTGIGGIQYARGVGAHAVAVLGVEADELE